MEVFALGRPVRLLPEFLLGYALDEQFQELDPPILSFRLELRLKRMGVKEAFLLALC